MKAVICILDQGCVLLLEYFLSLFKFLINDFIKHFKVWTKVVTCNGCTTLLKWTYDFLYI